MTNKVVTLGEVLMRLTVPQNKRLFQTDNFDVTFGGSEANVGISLAHFGVEATHITALPSHDLGERAARYLKMNSISNDGIVRRDGRLGIYFLETGAMQRPSKIVYDRFDSAFAQMTVQEINWDTVFEGATWFHYSGITPAISQNAANITLKALQIAKSKGITTSGDINYRRNLWQYGKNPLDIMPELVTLTDVVIGGRVDLQNCLGIHHEDWTENCKLVQKQFPNIQTFSKTIRESISASHNLLTAVLYHKDTLYTSKTYEMNNIIDRIGGGDAFMGGLIYGLMIMEKQDAIEFSVAASVLKHSTIGDANLSTVDEVNALVSGQNIGRLLR